MNYIINRRAVSYRRVNSQDCTAVCQKHQCSFNSHYKTYFSNDCSWCYSSPSELQLSLWCKTEIGFIGTGLRSQRPLWRKCWVLWCRTGSLSASRTHCTTTLPWTSWWGWAAARRCCGCGTPAGRQLQIPRCHSAQRCTLILGTRSCWPRVQRSQKSAKKTKLNHLATPFSWLIK